MIWWLIAVLVPAGLIPLGILVWIRSSKGKDPALPAVVGLGLFIMYVGYLIGLTICRLCLP